jgi:hypothetical protein
VIDAAGAIYVIGGTDGSTYFNDVRKSADGGARAGLGEYYGGYSGDTRWLTPTVVEVPRIVGCHKRARGVPKGTMGTGGAR